MSAAGPADAASPAQDAAGGAPRRRAEALRDLLRRRPGLVAATTLQALCAVFFIADVAMELPDLAEASLHPLIELAAVAALVAGAGFGARELRRLMRRNAQVESRLRAASGAFMALMEESFVRWGLTPSERDVALLSIKGLSVAEIAALRQTAVGTVKAQSSAVYRKAGVNSRAELLSGFIDELMDDTALPAPGRTAAPAAAQGEEPPPQRG